MAERESRFYRQGENAMRTTPPETSHSANQSANRAAAYREYLCLLVRLQLAAHWTSKVDLSGVVQQTLWDAAQSPLPESEAEFLACLRRMLVNNLRDEIRRQTAAKRDVRLETSLEAAVEHSSQRIDRWLAGSDPSPSQQMTRAEELCRLATALAELPEDQRQAVELHHLQGLSIGVTAQLLGRTKEATSALLYRTLKRLRQHLDRSEDS
jgi:RNA polymerase sigma-70 factor, ECF subfamily